jgi:hypothetical protein
MARTPARSRGFCQRYSSVVAEAVDLTLGEFAQQPLRCLAPSPKFRQRRQRDLRPEQRWRGLRDEATEPAHTAAFSNFAGSASA